MAVNADGDLFLKALPDFVAWDKVRIPNTVSQLLNVPVQAVALSAAAGFVLGWLVSGRLTRRRSD